MLKISKINLKINRVLQIIIVWVLAGIAFLTPIFILPATPEKHELNKSILFLIMVCMALIIWIFKAVYNKKLVILHSNLNYLLLFLLVIYFVSSLFSVNIINSFLGGFNQGSLSFIVFIAYLLYFFLIINNIKTIKHFKIIFFALIASFIVAILFSVLNLNNIFLLWFISATKKNAFNLTSSSSAGFLVFGAILLPLLITSGLKKVKTLLGWILKSFIILIIFLSLIVFNTINFPVIWYSLALGTALILIIVFSGVVKDQVDKKFIFLPILVFVFAVSSLALNLKPLLKREIQPEISLNRKISFEIAKNTLKSKINYFFIGSGPETFLYDFSSNKPESFNKNFLWNIRFEKPNNLYAELLSSLGIIGTLIFISFFIFILGDGIFLLTDNQSYKKKSSIKKRSHSMLQNFGSSIVRLDLKTLRKKEKKSKIIVSLRKDNNIILYATALFAAWFTFLVSHFFFSGKIATMAISWTVAGLICALSYIHHPKMYKKIKLSFKASAKYSLFFSFLFVLSISATVFLFTFILKLYLSNLKYVQAGQFLIEAQKTQDQGDKEQSIQNLNQATQSMLEAIRLNEIRPEYYLELAKIYLAQANTEALKGKDANQNALQTFLRDSLANAAKGTNMAGKNVNLWESRGQIYQNVALFSRDAQDWIIKSYEKVAELEPANPIAYTEAGKAYLAKAKFIEDDQAQKNIYEELLNKASDNFQKALEVKDNYLDAIYNLSQIYERKNMLNEAITEIRKAEQIMPDNLNLKYETGRLYFNRALTRGLENDEGKNDLNQAKTRFMDVLEKNPNYANTLYSLALIYEKEGNITEAIKNLEKVKELNPDNAEVQKKIDNLKNKSNQGTVEE